MANIVLGCDSNSGDSKYQNTVAKGLEDAGHSVEKIGIGSDPFADYDWGKTGNPKGKIGIYLMAASLISPVDSYNASPCFDYHYFVIRGDVSTLITSQSDFDTKGIPKDRDRDYGSVPHYSEWAGKTYKELNELMKTKCMCVFAKNAEDAVTALLNAISGNVSSGSSNNSDSNDDEEEWDDKDNFTPHKGKIMEVVPYKVFSSVSFDKSYDSPTGTGSVELLFHSKDYRFLYKGVAMRLKLKRSCDGEWKRTTLEDWDYDENEKFFKEHIPTNELLKELGLPNYRKQRILGQTTTENTESEEVEHISPKEFSVMEPEVAKQKLKHREKYTEEEIKKLEAISKKSN